MCANVATHLLVRIFPKKTAVHTFVCEYVLFVFVPVSTMSVVFNVLLFCSIIVCCLKNAHTSSSLLVSCRSGEDFYFPVVVVVKFISIHEKTETVGIKTRESIISNE